MAKRDFPSLKTSSAGETHPRVDLGRGTAKQKRIQVRTTATLVFVPAILPAGVTETPARLGDALPLRASIRNCNLFPIICQLPGNYRLVMGSRHVCRLPFARSHRIENRNRQFGCFRGIRNSLEQNSFWLQRPDLN